LLESYLTTTGIAPQSAADVELDLSFSTFRIDETTFSLAVRFAGRVAIAHFVANDRSGAPRLVSLLKLAAFDVRHGPTNLSGRDGRLASPTIPQLPRGGSGRDGRSYTRRVLRLGVATHTAFRSEYRHSPPHLADSHAARHISCP